MKKFREFIEESNHFSREIKMNEVEWEDFKKALWRNYPKKYEIIVHNGLHNVVEKGKRKVIFKWDEDDWVIYYDGEIGLPYKIISNEKVKI